MRNKTSTWFETKVRYEKMMEDGLQKKVTEQYVVDALSFTEAESKITEEMPHYVSGEMVVSSIARAPYSEIFFSDDSADDSFFKAKLHFITLDERTGKEKKTVVIYLVQAANLEKARKYIDLVMAETMIDYKIAGLNETKILDVFEHTA